MREFLLNLGVQFPDADNVSVPEGEDPPDVLFDGIRFEVKELYDEGRRRMNEYRQRLLEAQRAQRCAELWPPGRYAPTDTAVGAVLDVAIAVGAQHSQRYEPALVPTLDLLLYHNLMDVDAMFDEAIPDTTPLARQGWRSVSVLFGRRSIILCAAANAPAWLRMAVGRVTHRA